MIDVELQIYKFLVSLWYEEANNIVLFPEKPLLKTVFMRRKVAGKAIFSLNLRNSYVTLLIFFQENVSS